jgi:hypothetical protein
VGISPTALAWLFEDLAGWATARVRQLAVLRDSIRELEGRIADGPLAQAIAPSSNDYHGCFARRERIGRRISSTRSRELDNGEPSGETRPAKKGRRRRNDQHTIKYFAASITVRSSVAGTAWRIWLSRS